MKQIIIFTAFALIFCMSIIFQNDYSKVENMQNEVKNKIEDSASGAVFCIDEAAYAEGYIKFNDTEVINYIKHTLPSDYEAVVTIFDEQMRMYDQDGNPTGSAVNIVFPYTYTDEQGFKSEIKGPSVKIIAIKRTDDFYRLPFLKKTEVVRSTMYSWEERKDNNWKFF